MNYITSKINDLDISEIIDQLRILDYDIDYFEDEDDMIDTILTSFLQIYSTNNDINQYIFTPGFIEILKDIELSNRFYDDVDEQVLIKIKKQMIRRDNIGLNNIPELNIQYLPNEVLENILSQSVDTYKTGYTRMLDNAANVNKRMRSVVSGMSPVIHTYKLNEHGHEPYYNLSNITDYVSVRDESNMSYLFNKGIKKLHIIFDNRYLKYYLEILQTNPITHFYLSSDEKVSTEVFTNFMQFTTNLTHVVIDYGDFDDDKFIIISLTHPNIIGISLQAHDVTVDAIEIFFSKCRNIQKLEIQYMTDQDLKIICKYNNNLMDIDLTTTSDITDEGIQYLARTNSNIRKLWTGYIGNEALKTLLSNNSMLRELFIDTENEDTDLSIKEVKTIAEYCSNLYDLNISIIKSAIPGLNDIFSNNGKLRKSDIGCDDKLSDNERILLLSFIRNLTTITIHGAIVMTMNDVVNLINNNPNLVYLRVNKPIDGGNPYLVFNEDTYPGVRFIFDVVDDDDDMDV